MSITVSKTREILVDVARQLFARMGFDNTTMNDIAQASKKGRRTLYTYFKSKADIFSAVIESEMDQVHRVLVTITEQEIPADEKLILFLYTRLDAIKTIVFRNGTLKATFFRDNWQVEKARKKFNTQEPVLIKKILEQGVKDGLYEISDTEATAYIIHYALKGLEVPYIRGKIGNSDEEREKQKANVMNLVFNGIKIK
jgi:AcrR family transcriptional regulator